MGQLLRVVTYNIRKAIGLDRRRNPGRILDVLNRLDADLILLQEADKRLGARPSALPFEMIAAQSDYEIVPLATNGVSLGWHGNAILVRRGMTVLDVERLALPGLEPRGAVFARIAVEDTPVTVVGTHLGLLRPWRRRQLATITTHLGDRPNALIAGDFNEWARHRGLEALARGHTILAPGKSFHATRPMAALDRIAHGPGFETTDAGVDQSPTARISSDHLPVWAELRLNQNSPVTQTFSSSAKAPTQAR